MEAVLEHTRKKTNNHSQPAATAMAELLPVRKPEISTQPEETRKSNETDVLGQLIDNASRERVFDFPGMPSPGMDTEKKKMEENKVEEKKIEEKKIVENKSKEKDKGIQREEIKRETEKVTETRQTEVKKTEEKREKAQIEVAKKETDEVRTQSRQLSGETNQPARPVKTEKESLQPESKPETASPAIKVTIDKAPVTQGEEETKKEEAATTVSSGLISASPGVTSSAGQSSASSKRRMPSASGAPEASKEEGHGGEGGTTLAKSAGVSGPSGPAESVQPVQPLALEGSTDKMIESYTTARASQIAASYTSLGSAVTKQAGNEVKQTASEIPPLIAKNTGAEGDITIKSTIPGAANAEIQTGVTEPDSPAVKLSPHKDLAPPVNNSKNTGKINNQDEGGFWSWLKNAFSGFIGSVSTRDDGVNTKAGEAPKIDNTGTANPERLSNQRSEGDAQMTEENSKTTEFLKAHPGQQIIQPAKINEEAQVNIREEPPTDIVAPEQEEMMHFVNMPLPPSVREAADKRMAPMLDKSLAKPRADVQTAALNRDNEKNTAIENAQKEAALLNENAQKEQDEVVEGSRNQVASQQQEGIQEAQARMDEFNKEVGTEQAAAGRLVEDRVQNDQEKADKVLRDAEKDADKEKQKSEEKAARKKKEMEENGKKKSWWDKVKGAVKSVVNALTKAIDFIFTALRDAVKFLIEKAKNAALKLIEAGRAWIVSKLDQFGKWLKSKVNKYLSAFPALANRINAAIDSTVNKAKAVVNAVAARLKAGVEALANAVAGFIDSILSKFQTALKAAVQIVGAVLTGDFAEAAKIAFYAVCEIAGIDTKPILDFINRAGDTIMIIFKDPVQFFKNIASGVKNGLNQFVINIKKHLISGLISWLTGALSDVQITLPENFDLKGIFSLVMQILGLSYQNIRAKLVKKLGANGEKIISVLETSVEIVQELISKGPIALWDRLKEFLGNLKETVIGGIRDWTITNIIKAGVTWLLSMLNPASAIVKAIKMLYDVVMFFVERWKQIVAFVESIFNSVRELALGNLGKAANAVEGALGRSVPVIIGFMASLLGLGGIGKAVRNIIDKIRKPIDKGVDKVIDWLFEKGKVLFGKGKAMVEKGKEKVKGLFEWWKIRKKFKTKDGETHATYFKGSGKSASLMVASTPLILEQYLSVLKQRYKSNEAKSVIKKIEDEATLINNLKKDPDTGKDKTMSRKIGEQIEIHLNNIAAFLADPVFEKKEIIPPTKISKKPKTIIKDKIGHQLTAQPLSLNPGGNAGSVPSEESDIWNKVNQRSGVYVRGHLLNHHLHGPGKNDNLIPVTGKFNTNMEAKVESKAKELVLGKKEVIKFSVQAQFGKHGKRKHIPEEEFLPTSFKFELQTMKLIDGKIGENTADWVEDKSKKIPYAKEMKHDLPPDTPVGGDDIILHNVTRVDLLKAFSSSGFDVTLGKTLFTAHFVDKINKKKYSGTADFKQSLDSDLSWSKEGEKNKEAMKYYIPYMVDVAKKLKY